MVKCPSGGQNAIKCPVYCFHPCPSEILSPFGWTDETGWHWERDGHVHVNVVGVASGSLHSLMSDQKTYDKFNSYGSKYLNATPFFYFIYFFIFLIRCFCAPEGFCCNVFALCLDALQLPRLFGLHVSDNLISLCNVSIQQHHIQAHLSPFQHFSALAFIHVGSGLIIVNHCIPAVSAAANAEQEQCWSKNLLFG